MDKKIGIIGLGRCGLPAARRFAEQGWEVFSSARRPEVIKEFKSFGGVQLPSPAQVAARTKNVIVIVLNDDQVREVVAGPEGLLSSAQPGSLIIHMSTVRRTSLEETARICAGKGVDLLDCPFTGGPARVANGTLTLIAAAEERVMAAARPIVEVIGQVTVAGDKPGMGQAVKHCNQLLVTAIHAATIELITLAKATGVDPELVCQVTGSGIGGNDYFRLLSAAILHDSPSPGGMGQLWKDVNIVVDSAKRLSLPLLVATATAQYFDMAERQGMSGQDSARLIKVLERMSQPQ